ncbi:MAG TPA: tRNA (adenosine(37)-N6)-threonylcarbamoyltransferase complex ATPase subunit type 1 TsaE, partial [bacterium]|nr:tRNA (adenosine(37)-N6)-threonylcarbamoyltransferase complex ATPase subunit type 1 TsaE [bacterium]
MRPQKKKAQTFFSRSPGETKRLGAWLARKLRQGDLVCFCGELGSGKTTMIQGLVRSLTGQRAASPSFVILHEYDRGKLPVYHFDFYRLGKPDDLETI